MQVWAKTVDDGQVDVADWPLLVGRLCSLRVLDLDDALIWLDGEDAQQRRWFASPPGTEAGVVRAIENWRRSWFDDGPIRHWGIRVCGELAGGVELQQRGDGRTYLSFLVFPDFRRRGVAADAVQVAIGWMSHDWPVSQVVAVVDEENVASQATVRRCGFVCDGPAERWEYREPGYALRYVWTVPKGSSAVSE